MLEKAVPLRKIPGESRLYDFECMALLDEGETITSVPSLTVDPSTTPALTVGTATYSGTRVQIRVSAGKSGTTYTFAGLAVTSNGNTVAFDGSLFVK